MTKEKFSKGGWVIDERISGVIENEDGVICDVWSGTHDAHLIAAAPEMYDALQEISAFASFKPDNKELQLIKIDIEKLLAKARGEHE